MSSVLHIISDILRITYYVFRIKYYALRLICKDLRVMYKVRNKAGNLSTALIMAEGTDDDDGK